MYATCLFCSGALGRNESIEHFPVGRRLAFDPAKGRLWVVCPSCRRWNLSPLEIRWEAIEEAERAYRGTRLRASTEHIGLAKLKEGTELVRIGTPLLPEFAAWRYGEIFRRRRRAAMLAGGAILAGQLLPAINVFGMSALTSIVSATALSMVGGAVSVIGAAGGAHQWRTDRRHRAVIRGNDQRLYRVDSSSAITSAIYTDVDDDTWSLRLSYRTRWRDGVFWRSLAYGDARAKDPGVAELTGDLATRALATLLPAVNRKGAGSRLVDEAVGILVDAGSATALLSTRATGGSRPAIAPGCSSLVGLQPGLRLALEMALHQDDERRALEGELKALEDRWREAEEVAAIADSMFYPTVLDERLTALREPPRPPDL